MSAGSPRLATVVTARPWESELVAFARATGTARVVARLCEPAELERIADAVDVVVVGAETPWATPALLRRWSRRGLPIIGVFPAGDQPAARLLRAGRPAEVFADSAPAPAIVAAARLLALDRPPVRPEGALVGVLGPPGAPGRSELALALAWGMAADRRTLLVDLDRSAPSLAVRLGLPPRPDAGTVGDLIRAEGELGAGALHRVGDLDVIPGPAPSASGPISDGLLAEVVLAARGSFEAVVADLGPAVGDDPLVATCDRVVLVCEASPVGLVRGATLAADWCGPTPELVLNRTVPEAEEAEEAVAAARRWIGLEPAAVVPQDEEVRRAACRAEPPHPGLVRCLAPLRLGPIGPGPERSVQAGAADR